MVQVQRLAVRITPGRAADFDEFFDLRMPDRQIDRSRAPAQGSLADRQREGIHDADEGDDTRCLAIAADRLTDGTQVAPIAADAATTGRQPDVFVPQADDAFQAVGAFVEEAADGKAATGPAIGQDRSRGHEPELGNIVVEALGMCAVVGVMHRNPCEHVLIAFTGHQIPVGQRCLAEFR